MRKDQFARGCGFVESWLASRVKLAMKSEMVKRSVVIAGHKRTILLEEVVWKSLKEIAACRNMTLSALLATIDSKRKQGHLSSAVRLFVLDFYREQLGNVRNRRRVIEAALHGSAPGLH